MNLGMVRVLVCVLRWCSSHVVTRAGRDPSSAGAAQSNSNDCQRGMGASVARLTTSLLAQRPTPASSAAANQRPQQRCALAPPRPLIRALFMLLRPLAAARSCHMLATLHVLHDLTRSARRAQVEDRKVLVTSGIDFLSWSCLAWRARRPRGSSCTCLRRNSRIRVRTSSLEPHLRTLPIRRTRCTRPPPADRSRHCAPLAPGDLR